MIETTKRPDLKNSMVIFRGPEGANEDDCVLMLQAYRPEDTSSLLDRAAFRPKEHMSSQHQRFLDDGADVNPHL